MLLCLPYKNAAYCNDKSAAQRKRGLEYMLVTVFDLVQHVLGGVQPLAVSNRL